MFFVEFFLEFGINFFSSDFFLKIRVCFWHYSRFFQNFFVTWLLRKFEKMGLQTSNPKHARFLKKLWTHAPKTKCKILKGLKKHHSLLDIFLKCKIFKGLWTNTPIYVRLLNGLGRNCNIILFPLYSQPIILQNTRKLRM